MDLPAFSADDIARLYALAKLMFLATARPLGFAILFSAFSWSHLNTGILRLGFAIVIAMPLLAGFSTHAAIIVEELPGALAVVGMKELLIGVLIGFLAALPFEALIAAGGIVDIYRGSGPTGGGPTGEASPHGTLFMAAALWLFASLGGFWLLAEAIYATYAVWPIGQMLPSLTSAGLTGVFDLVTRLTLLAAATAAPLMILMGASDLIFSISGKIGKNINITFLSATAKNLLVLFALPLFMLVLSRSLPAQVLNFNDITPLLRQILR